jgi:hypothetical protein
MNPTAPNLHATIKLHKHNIPIRTIINWTNAPAYKLVELLSKTLHSYLQLPYTHNVQNYVHLMTDPQTTELNKDMRLCSFDIENMYTNIPKIDIINIINTIIKTTKKLIKYPKRNNTHIKNSTGTKLFPSRPGILQTNLRISNGSPDIINTGRKIYTTHGAHTNIPHPNKTTNSRIL